MSSEPKANLRKPGKRGFDIISNSFFVEEESPDTNAKGKVQNESASLSFSDFDSYYSYLNGDIYNNACYTFWHIPDDIVSSYGIDIKRLKERSAFVEDSVEDCQSSTESDERESYERGEEIQRNCQNWIKKFNACNSYSELAEVKKRYEINFKRRKFFSKDDCPKPLSSIILFFFFNYIYANVEDENRFSAIMEYMSSGEYPECDLIYALCSIYDPDDVIQSYNYSSGSKSTIYKHKKDLKDYVQLLKAGEIVFSPCAFFDKDTHYFCEKVHMYKKSNMFYRFPGGIYRYFETFEEFINYRNGDLTNCDLSAALELDVDFSKYETDETTILPRKYYTAENFSVEKTYDNGEFHVLLQLQNESGNILKEDRRSFKYFFDFVAFLKGDLSGADLLLCDGLVNLEEWNSINFTGAKMRSSLCEKFGLKYETYKIKSNLIGSFERVEKNEEQTALALRNSRDLIADALNRGLSSFDVEADHNCQKVNYISDIHLMHRILHAKCRSTEDILYVIQKVVDTIVREADSILLIAGDVASDFAIFELFIKCLSQTLENEYYPLVVFTLGNHELWGLQGLSKSKVVNRYRSLLDKHGMYLLHNDILYIDDHDINDPIHLIKYKELCKMDDKQIVDRLRNARYVILGSLGFSGYNSQFNADSGIYRGAVDRSTEIEESKKFEALYNRLYPILKNKNTVILTHTPKEDWCKEATPDGNLIYVSGHTHKNFYYDDGEFRVYSDNQIGYYNENPHLKTFLMDNDYDCFSDYADGIHKITREQYIDFYRGKNKAMTFTHDIYVLHMLKKNGYYCFIQESPTGRLQILNGGSPKKLERKDIQYYYDNMDEMISTIESPLDKFTSFQENIAKTIKRIGGTGTIHGCIIDIDFNNHIYVNPVDSTVVGYWASDMINKIVYPSIPSLLEKNCPELFGQYIRLLDSESQDSLVLKQQSSAAIPQEYFDTDIYRASREIKKMQKLNSNILSLWNEDALSKKHVIDLT